MFGIIKKTYDTNFSKKDSGKRSHSKRLITAFPEKDGTLAHYFAAARGGVRKMLTTPNLNWNCCRLPRLFWHVSNWNKYESVIRKLSLHLSKLFPRRVYYINGPEMLPAPLSADEEFECLKQLSQGEESAARARSELIVHNLRLVVYIAKKFENTGIGVEDLVSIGTIGLIKAVNTFCPERNIKLATYASRCIENEILMYLRKSSGLKNEVSIDEPLNIDWDGNELLLSDVLGTENDIVHQGLEKDVEKGLLEDAIGHLSSRERTIMEMRFGLCDGVERTQKEVADTLGISQSYISRLEKRIILRLRKDIERVS